MNEFEKEALETHNRYRRRHGVPELKYSQIIAADAQKWAEELAKLGTLEHSDKTEYGENCASGSGSGDYDMSGKDVSIMWYKDYKKYDFDNPVWGAGGHFTQMVWKSSTEFGIGKTKNADGKIFIVGHYLPAGNIKGQYENNVFPASGPVDDDEEEKSAKRIGPQICDVCKQEVKKFYETKDGGVLCVEDYEKQAPKCAGCDESVIGEIISAMEKKWHTKCFVCAECKKPFDGPFFHKEGKPYCKPDYEKIFMGGEQKPTECHGCKEAIENKWIKALGYAWHHGCFKCKGCEKSLEGESFFKKNEDPYCEKCA
ncbi:uncharacterized protein LOC100371303 [Saccoglossus kowalevskii]|uniref:LIM domain-containing protein B-like n=1 Tax=Saccoglossus kowalevskii TaxID=10224 RepID=A0ABM0GMA4_SACKO|nr:PREDICTED: LIM domain-containing protein B-like [Saccoglossus kowalevskii]